MGLFSSIASIAAPFVGGLLGDKSDEKINSQNAELQREFAQMGVRWKVEDAKAAGIHPLYALGAQTSPAQASYGGGGNFARALANSGQDISRAIHATRPRDERLQALAEENASLQNDRLRVELAASKRALLGADQVGPPGPSGPGWLRVPSEITHSRPGDASMTAGPPTPATTTFRNRDGSESIWPSRDAKNSIEDSPYELEHMFRNRLMPALNDFAEKIHSRGYYYPRARKLWR